MSTPPRRELILRLFGLPLWVLFVSGVRACARQAQTPSNHYYYFYYYFSYFSYSYSYSSYSYFYYYSGRGNCSSSRKTRILDYSYDARVTPRSQRHLDYNANTFFACRACVPRAAALPPPPSF